MTTVSTEPQMRLRSPEDILAATPYLLGFHPADSIVVLGLTGKRLSFHVRGDLPPAGSARRLVDELGNRFGDLFQAHGVTGVVLVGYGTPQGVTPVIMAIRHAMRRRRIDVREMLRATGGLFWSYLCKNPKCCPPEGTPYEVAGTAVAAMATLAGCVAMPDRAAVMRSLAPPAGLALVSIEQATDRANARFCDLVESEGHSAAVHAVGERAVTEAYECYGRDGRLSDDDLAWLCVLLQMLSVRDFAWHRIDTDGRQSWPTHERLWTDVLRRCDPQLAAPPGLLLGYTLWRSGEGMRANLAVERALTADPRYSAAQLMAEVLQRAVPPSAVDQVRRQRQRGRKRSRARAGRRRRR